MNTLTLVALTLSAPADPPKGAALDTSFLKMFAETRGFTLGRPQKPKFTPDGKTVLFLRAEPKTPTLKLFAFDIATGKTRELLSPESLLKGADENVTPEEKARRERQRVSTGGFADYHLNPAGTHVLVALGGKLHVFDMKSEKATTLKTGDGAIVDPKWSPDGKRIAYVRGFDVFAYDLDAAKEWAVTSGGTATKTHGLAEFVAQEEMGRHSGFWWSPDGKHIAYTEADHAGVERWHVADPFKPFSQPSPQFYPRPGKKNVAVKLGVIPVDGGKTVWVEWDRKEWEYLAAVRWDAVKADPQGRLTIQLQDRGQHDVQLALVDPKTGKFRTLFNDQSPALVNLFPELPRWSDDGEHFLCARHIDNDVWLDRFRMHKDWVEEIGHLDTVRPRELLFFDPKGGLFLVGGWSDQKNPSRTVLTKVEWKKEERPVETDLAPATPGQYTAVANADLSTVVVTGTTLEKLPRAVLLRLDGTSLGELPSVALEPPFVPNVTVAKVGDFWTAVVRPRDFDPKKKYPVLVDVYGGPKHLRVVQAMRNWLVPQWLADQGFVVVAIDNRGTPGRGRDWERAIYGKFGTVPLEDQVKGVQALCDAHPELDRDRVGIVGWSFGGYMAANGVLRRPDIFKAAVAGAPVTDWEDYDTHYTERYMGLLPENKAAYDEASLLPLAKNLSRPLLLVSGTADDNVYFRHTLKLTDALFRAGREFEVLPLPGITHMYAGDPQVTERLWAKIATFFKQHLGTPR